MSDNLFSPSLPARRQLLSIICLLPLLVSLAACQPPPPQRVGAPSEGPRQGGKLIYGLTLVVSGIDPHVDASSELGIPLTSVYDTLVYQDLDGTFVPGLAERWEVSDDGLVYTFHLRKNVIFHDGTPFTAQAVKFSFDRIADPQTKSRKAASLLGPYDHTEVLNDHTVRVHFRRPHAAFLDAASQVYLAIVSPTAVQKWGAEYQEHQVGTGPFKLKEYVPKDHLILERNPDYHWAPAVYRHQGPAYLDEIEFRFFPDPASRVLALESGQAHVMGEIPPQDVARLQRSPDFDIVPVPIPGQPLQFFINSEKPPTDDLQVRQALLYATDRQAIVQAIFRGTSPPAYGPLCAVTWGYDESVRQMYPHDPARAAALLEKAGWVDTDGDGIRDKDGQPLVLQMILMSWGYVPEVGQMLQAQWRQVGIEVQMQEMAFPAALAAAREGQHHLAPMLFSSSDPGILSATFHSANAEAGFNWAKVRDEELDRLLDAGAQAMDEKERLALYAQAQHRIMDLALIIPIRDYVNLNGISAKVKGLRYDHRGWFPWLHDVYLME